MALTVFFSWQVDRLDGGERSFIERCLKDGLKRIAADATVESAVREIEVDRDTKGVPGTPPIADTIFAKIDRAAIFVPDLTFVAQRADGRPAPNPNVLIEYGWALKSMGHSRMMPVMNVAHGEPTAEAMPFDMRHLRNPILFNLPPGADDAIKRAERDRLSRELEAAIRMTIHSGVLNVVVPKPPAFPAAEPKDGLARFRPSQTALGRTYPHFVAASSDVFLADGPAMWLRVMPTGEQGRRWSTAELRASATAPDRHLLPLAAMGRSLSLGHLRAEDGFGVYLPMQAEKPTPSVVFVFETGEVWGIDAYSVNEDRAIPLAVREFADALEQYSAFLKDKLGIDPPYRCVLDVEGVADKPVWLPTAAIKNPFGSCVANRICVERVHADGADPRATVRPLFEAVLDKCGVPDFSLLDRL